MDPKTYMDGVLETEAQNYSDMHSRLGYQEHQEKPDPLKLPEGWNKVRLLHAIMGVSDEAGELNNALKGHIFYGKPLDRVNLLEEFGDMMYFAALGISALGSSIEEVFQSNHDKLAKRYQKGWTQKEALERDLTAERDVLEKDLNT